MQEAPKKRYRDWAGLANSLQRDADLPRQQLAQTLGVSAESLVQLRVGWNRWDRYWSFPEMDGGGHVIGINARYESGQKKRLFGSRSGLTHADSWNVGEGPILLPEGASDTAALMTIGLNAVGRPSNAGGVDLLIDLLFEIPIQRGIVVIGERDKKTDGKWPGRGGAISTATRLAEAFERPIDWAFPPDNAKDSRAWLKSLPSLPGERLADLFITGIDTKQINPPITLRIDPEPENTLPLGQWREMMLHARLQSLGKPGAYLDCSPTGSGKSHVDFAAVQVLLQREGTA
jgi:hypothetical protein